MRGEQSYGRSRNLLYARHLEAFRKWIVRRGWFEVPTNDNNGYEVLRLRRHSDHVVDGEPSLSIIYRREKTKPFEHLGPQERHLTVQANLVPFVEQFFDEEIRHRSTNRTKTNKPVSGRP